MVVIRDAQFLYIINLEGTFNFFLKVIFIPDGSFDIKECVSSLHVSVL